MQTAETERKTAVGTQPRFRAAAGDDDLACAAAQLAEKSPQPLPIRFGQASFQRRAGNPGRRLEIVPDQKEAPLFERFHQRRLLAIQILRHRMSAKQRFHHLVEHVFAAADVVESEPETALAQAIGRRQPFHQTTGQRGFADPGQAVNQNPCRWPPQRSLQVQQRTVAPDETVGILAIPRFRRQFRFLDHRPLAGVRKAQIRRLLLIHHRHQPIVQRKPPSHTYPPGIRQHRLPPSPHPFRHVAALEHAPVKRGQKRLRAAHVQGIRHRHHAANPCP